MSILVITGGVGGAKLALGLTRLIRTDDLIAIVNTGDDFVHLGLPVSPDIDTLLYTLSNRSDLERGWGRAGETWSFMAALKELGGPDWFNLGDGDIALHVSRLAAFAGGGTLSAVTDAIARRWEVGARVLPMSDDRVATVIETDEGALPFQDYFVRRRCEPAARAIRFEGAGQARPAPGVLEAIAGAEVVLIAPSNPWLSVDPILAVPGLRAALTGTAAPVVAVSPLVAGQAVKGPTAKLMGELGLPLTHASIAAHYDGLLDGLVTHLGDDDSGIGVPTAATDTLMRSLEDRERVAAFALEFARSLAR